MPRTCKKCNTVFEGRRCDECHRRESREYAKANQEKVKAYKVAYAKANAEKLREKHKKYREQNILKIKARKSAYAAANSEKLVAKVTEWRRSNPEAKRIQAHNYRARKEGRGKLSRGLAKQLYEIQKGKCACCWRSLEEGYQMDHIEPLAKGGLNVDQNIQLLTPLCNTRKHARTQEEYEAIYGAENGYGLV